MKKRWSQELTKRRCEETKKRGETQEAKERRKEETKERRNGEAIKRVCDGAGDRFIERAKTRKRKECEKQRHD